MATWNRAVETLPREELASLQLKGLRKTLRRLGRAEVSALEELARLPFSTAADCRGRTLLSRCRADRRELVELHVDPVMSLAIAATKGDLLQNAEAVARGFAMAGLEKGDAFAVLEPLSLQGDGLACYQGCRKAGLFCLPAGDLAPVAQAELLAAAHAKGVFASVATLLRLPSVAGLQSLKTALVPAAGLTEGLRRELETRFGFAVFAAYGRAETGGFASLGHECRVHDGFHVWEDQCLVEIVDPKTGAVLPDGDRGEVVLTTLAREAMPLLRDRTGEVGRVVSRERCACGRTSLRLALGSAR